MSFMRTGSPSPSHLTTSRRLWMSRRRSAFSWDHGRMVSRAVSRCMAPRSHLAASPVHEIVAWHHRSPPVLEARQDGDMSDSDGEGTTHEATTAPTETTEISEAASAYAAVRPEVEAATALFVDMVTGLLDDA